MTYPFYLKPSLYFYFNDARLELLSSMNELNHPLGFGSVATLFPKKPYARYAQFLPRQSISSKEISVKGKFLSAKLEIEIKIKHKGLQGLVGLVACFYKERKSLF